MLKTILNKLAPTNTRLVAVSKTKPPQAILDMYGQGQRIFGENRVQELVEKQEQLPDDIEWHFIGHLQTNKVKYIAPFVTCIHAVDSLKLIKEINKQAKKHDRTIDCLLQFHIATEETKYGLDLTEAQEILQSEAWQSIEHVRIIGVMGMATFTEDLDQVRQEFKNLYQVFTRLKTDFFADKPHFKEISMGMSGDFEVAIEEGSTMVRIGTMLFGARS